MARRPLPRILTVNAPIGRSRAIARTAVDNATDVLHPLIVVTRGLHRLAVMGRRRWSATPKERRGPALFLGALGLATVAVLPYGPLLALIVLMAAAAWAGHDRISASGPTKAELGRLRVLYEALVPYFSTADDPTPLYAHGGDCSQVFTAYEFDDHGRLTGLRLRYPPWFTDGEASSRRRIEQLLHAKSGRGREYLFEWEEEANELSMSVLEPLPTDIHAQRFVTAPGEIVLGFTDPGGVQRLVPVAGEGGTRDAPPVVWRTGARSTEPHLLALGPSGSGLTTLVRSIALQALHHGDVLVLDGSGTGEYACLVGRSGVLAVESGLAGALASLEWAATETERRLIAGNRARQLGRSAPKDTRRPLWLLFDRPSVLSHLATSEDRTDPQELLQVPLRHGRSVAVTVVVAEQLDCADSLGTAVQSHTPARVALGPCTAEQIRAVLGVEPHTTPVRDVPPGRGYARLGSSPVHRLQVPATPDPYDDAASETHRRAVLELLPEHTQIGSPTASRATAHAGGTSPR
ncbi:hypothetical protein [Streptomyces sp. KR80]|uniref:hypothetical protein n=1 Tax=Streptomyces sp. KR80 TaxID=3457426 RepID=UPI003FD2CB75